MADPRIARIERGIIRAATVPTRTSPLDQATTIVADLYAWQAVAERHATSAWNGHNCVRCNRATPCDDRQAADAALDRLDHLWGQS